MSDELIQVRDHLARHDQRLDELESRVGTEAGLRAMMDHDDVGGLKADVGGLKAAAAKTTVALQIIVEKLDELLTR